MPTDEERREVAERLRELVADCFDDGEFYDRCEAEDILGLATDDGAWYEAAGVRRLADLIEPEERTCRNTYDGREFRCSECGVMSHVLVRDEAGDWQFISAPPFCPNCGSRLVSE